MVDQKGSSQSQIPTLVNNAKEWFFIFCESIDCSILVHIMNSSERESDFMARARERRVVGAYGSSNDKGKGKLSIFRDAIGSFFSMYVLVFEYYVFYKLVLSSYEIRNSFEVVEMVLGRNGKVVELR
ncbi:hypothetical protein Scep_011907 [Stephania cephalantha]|uniref:Transmembrane protein n=1 Tax=Stephania cephalantha TaxID=152367 RepID=A0AAP0JE89_9MAGN